MTATSVNANSVLTERVVALLNKSATQVEVIQTHLSQVFLTDRHVYKLKKPVKFPFVDFSTLGKRERACRDEVRLNRRLAPGTYLDVVPITQGRYGELRLGGEGEVLDWLVKMRRLPADRALDELIRDGRLTDGDKLRLVAALTAIYEQMPPLTLTTDEYLRRLRQQVRDNFRELTAASGGVSSPSIRRVHAAQLRLLAIDGEMFRRRVLDGRLVDGHGDLRPEHIYLTVPPTIIDCLEFSSELRQLDVADELSFLAMECEQLGAATVGQAVLDAYQRQSGDDLPAQLLAYYKSYRACVRAKVSLIREAQANAPDAAEFHRQAADYLDLADDYASQLGPPHLIVLGGLMGSGKTTLANALAEALGCEVLRTDLIRREMFGPAGREHCLRARALSSPAARASLCGNAPPRRAVAGQPFVGRAGRHVYQESASPGGRGYGRSARCCRAAQPIAAARRKWRFAGCKTVAGPGRAIRPVALRCGRSKSETTSRRRRTLPLSNLTRPRQLPS